MTQYIGIDPGQKGGLALLDSYGELLEVYDMPVTGEGRTGEVNVRAVAGIISDWSNYADDAGIDTIVIIENVHSMPKMGVVGAFKFGRSKGILEGVAAALELRTVYVDPAKWKRDMKLTKDKGRARKMASDRWPKHAAKFARVKDDGRAEAALIGLWQVQHGS